MIAVARRRRRGVRRYHRAECRYARTEPIKGIGGIERVVRFLWLTPCKVCRP